MIEKIVKFADTFDKSARILGFGESTVSLREAQEIAKVVKAGFDQIQTELLASYPHDNFSSVLDSLISGSIPAQQQLDGAWSEFESGLKAFQTLAPLYGDVRKMTYVQSV